MTDLEPAVFHPPNTSPRSRLFVSLRWKLILPLVVGVMIVSMIGAYATGTQLTAKTQDRADSRLRQAGAAALDQIDALAESQQREITRIIYTQGVVAAILDEDGSALQAILEPLAAAADLDYLLVADAEGREIMGLRRVLSAPVDYAVATGADLAALAPPGDQIRPLILKERGEYALASAATVLLNDRPAGVVVIGVRLDRVLADLRGGEIDQLALFGTDGDLLAATFAEGDRLEIMAGADDTIALASLTLAGDAYRAAYVPLVVNGVPLGTLVAAAPDDTLFASATSRRVAGMAAAWLVAVVAVVGFAALGHFASRLEQVTAVARLLVSGEPGARTGMRPTDEIGELGSLLDRLVDRYQRKTDSLQHSLRQQRRETTRLTAVLESIPDGLIVQDLQGRVLLINETARTLLGEQQPHRLVNLSALVNQALGAALAPGIYALGDPTRIPYQDRVLQAQAAAILAGTTTRIGTVTVLRDITDDVSREQARDHLLERLSEEATVPPAIQSYDSLSVLAREVVRNTRSLQQVINDLRDLSTFEPRDLRAGMQPLSLNDLLHSIAAEWQPLAKSAGMRLLVRFGPRGQYVLGNERRLRWAVGNVLDNTIKYSPPGRAITLSACVPADTETADILIEDQGYGIAPDDLRNLFTRFYRGTPRDLDGKPVRKPGTGQGLFIAQRVIEAHAGTIRLTSRVGIGTVVMISLPLTSPVTLELPAEVSESESETIETRRS